MEREIREDISSVYLYLIGLFVAAAAVFFFAFSSCGALGYGSLCIAAIVGLFYLMRFTSVKHPKGTKICNRILSYAVLLFAMVFAITEGAIFVSAASGSGNPAGYAIVMGAQNTGDEPSDSLLSRLEAAKSYLDDNSGSKCVVSGGLDKGETVSEGECMYLWLTENGVDPGRIIKEEKADGTKENVENSYALICADAGSKVENVTVITSDYHILRTDLACADVGFSADNIAVPTKNIVLRVNYYFREAFALWGYMIER